jgi:hypothetical protein
MDERQQARPAHVMWGMGYWIGYLEKRLAVKTACHARIVLTIHNTKQ